MSSEPLILLVGDFITDRTWLVGEPSLLERYNSHYSVHPHTLVDPSRETDVAGGIATVARTIGAVAANKIIVAGAWSYYIQNEFDDPQRRLIPPEGLLAKNNIDFRRVYRSDFSSVKTRVYLPEPGGARLSYRFDRNLSVVGSNVEIDGARYEKMEWPKPEDVGLIILGDYGYGVLHLPEVQNALKQYVDREHQTRRAPIILRSSNRSLVESLPWDVLMLNLHHCANYLGRESFDTPVTKQVNGECNYHPALIEALSEMGDNRISGNRAVLLNLESEGALLLHKKEVDPFILAAPHEQNVTGVGANDVLLAHFGLGLLSLERVSSFEEKLHVSCERAVRASAAFVARALKLEEIKGWSAPKLEVIQSDIERATPVLQRQVVTLANLNIAVHNARAPMECKRILMRNSSWYLDGFHTVDAAFGAEIVRLKNRIKEYVNSPSPKRPFLAVLCGDPGSGKSTLAEALGRYSGCEFIPANAAQWTSADDLFDLCERIRNARMLGNTPLAFIDEVDSDESLYAKLLAPVWDGTYSKQGQVRTLGMDKPTVFLLAGSNDAWKSGEKLFQAAEKGDTAKLRDLVSRLTAPPLDILPLSDRIPDISYLVAHQIMRKFPRVSGAGKGIFDLFTGSNTRHGARSMSMVIDMFGPLHQERFLSTRDFRTRSTKELTMNLSRTPAGWEQNDERVEISP